MSEDDPKRTGNRHVVEVDTDDLDELADLLEEKGGDGDDRRPAVHRIDLDDSEEDFERLLHRTLGEAAGEPVPPPRARRVTPPPPPGGGSRAPRRDDDGHAEESRIIDDLRTKMKELTDETDSFRRRISAQAADAHAAGQEDVCRRLLPVIDALELALQSARDTHDPDKLVHGLELVLKQLIGELGSLGLEGIDAVGQPFDPSLHEAFQQRRTGRVEPGHVASLIRRGYRFNDKLLRAAQVVVEGSD
ncbi:MAG: nucleotide exchange factor GrpE [Myxococcota bacterium]